MIAEEAHAENIGDGCKGAFARWKEAARVEAQEGFAVEGSAACSVGGFWVHLVP